MTMAPRPCGECHQVYQPSKKNQRFCTIACRGKSQERNRDRYARAATRDRIAPAMVRDWSPSRRERIRELLTQPWWAGEAEIALVALIDKISAQEASDGSM